MSYTIRAVLSRELRGYFETPVAYVFAVVFLLLSGILTFYVGGLYERGQADLETFFAWHPWLYLFLVPAISMRLWAEERRTGTLELLLTLPSPATDLVIGKFLAAWAYLIIVLFLTFPIWMLTAYLGDPDHGVILTGYIGSILMAGGYLAIGSAMSALTRNQVIAFVLSIVVCFCFTLSGFPMVLNFFSFWLPQPLVEVVGSFSFITHFQEMSKGLLSLKQLVYFLSLISFWLYINTVALNVGRGA